jgi:hypothetical protein
MAKLLAACLALAGLSLLLPSEPSYDPWAWLVWGREIAHGELDTTGGSSWKPLPVAFTLLFSPFSALDDSIPAALWMLVARTGALLALVLAFRLASRLAGGGVAGAVGGMVAAAALFLLPDWLQFSAHGSEAPWAVALMLWAICRHLDGRRDHAFVLGVLACLLRPELVPFLGLYALWLWRAEPRLRLLVAAALALPAAAWVVPEWIGSGNPLDGGRQATSEPAWSLSHAERPWLSALELAHDHAGLVVELLAFAALAWALFAGRRAPVLLAGAAAACVALFAAMTQAGFSGNPRYVLPALGLMCVLAGAGAALILAAPGSLASRPSAALGTAVAAVSLALVGAPFVEGRAERLRDEAREVGVRMDMHRDLADAVDRLGGAAAVTALGTATANRAFHSHLAWELKVPISAVERVTDHRVVFRTWRELSAGRVFFTGRARVRRTLTRVGDWRVYRREGLSFPQAQARARAQGRPALGPARARARPTVRPARARARVYNEFAGNYHRRSGGRIAVTRVVTI